MTGPTEQPNPRMGHLLTRDRMGAFHNRYPQYPVSRTYTTW
jgi:hypothetical protein